MSYELREHISGDRFIIKKISNHNGITYRKNLSDVPYKIENGFPEGKHIKDVWICNNADNLLQSAEQIISECVDMKKERFMKNVKVLDCVSKFKIETVVT